MHPRPGFPADFAAESLYLPEHWYVHELLELGPDRVRGRTDTTALGPWSAAQVTRHGQVAHVPAAVMVQITGTLANLHTVYALGNRISEGWVGYGTHVRSARFPSFGELGPPMDVTMDVKRIRRLHGRVFVEYRFLYEQGGREVYTAEQAAVWFLTPPSSPGPSSQAG